MSVNTIAERLVELCRAGKFEQAQTELYAPDATSTEAPGSPQAAHGPAVGLQAIREKGHQFQASIEAFHGISVSDAVVAGNWFSLAMTLDVTMKNVGRIPMSEICVYHVKDGHIVSEQFFYDVG
jgi:ketosteroid isomerase-like protein